MEVVVGEAYGWILFEAIVISIHLWFTGMLMGVIRKKVFNKDFYQKKFPQYKSLGKVMKPDGGYPDDGQGRLADLLDDESWFTLNNYRRAHSNYLEGALSVLVPLLIAGVSYPRWTFIAGLLYILGREIYSQGYRRSGSKGRMIGVVIVDVTLLFLWSMSLYTAFRWGNGFQGLKRLILFF